jgi:Ligand-gated ion channel
MIASLFNLTNVTGEYIHGRNFGLRILLTAWCLMCVILINAYTGNLTSYLAVPSVKPIPNSFEELAARKDLQIMVEDKGQLAEDILVNLKKRLNFKDFNRINISSRPRRGRSRNWAIHSAGIRSSFSKLRRMDSSLWPPEKLFIQE